LNQLYRFCYSLTVDETNAHDLLQNSLEKFLKSKTKKDNDLAFMYKIIRISLSMTLENRANIS
jgi:DNA-directed RNA polymerase specialized sigma24 family protein